MKLKQNAKGVDPSKGEKAVPMKERRFFFARYGKEGENKPYWLPAVSYVPLFQCGEHVGSSADSLALYCNALHRRPAPVGEHWIY